MTRRPRDGAPARSLTIRVYDEDREAWILAQKAAGVKTLSAWMVSRLNKAATVESGTIKGKNRSKA